MVRPSDRDALDRRSGNAPDTSGAWIVAGQQTMESRLVICSELWLGFGCCSALNHDGDEVSGFAILEGM